MPEPNSGCWLWLARIGPRGYGVVATSGTTKALAHRYSLELYSGQKIPNDLLALHKCDNPMCVNPEHLYVATGLDNARDASMRVWPGKWRNPNSRRGYKLSAHKAERIRRQLDANVSVTELARIYGVDRGTIRAVKSGKTWLAALSQGEKP